MWPFGRRAGKLTMEQAIARAERLVHKYDQTGPYRLVEDPVVLRNLVRGLARNWVRHGLPLCPCKKVTGKREVDKWIVCPCRDHHDEISRDGSCFCGLFLKGD